MSNLTIDTPEGVLAFTFPDVEQNLITLGEECAELQQEIAKIQRFGLTPDNLERFQTELGQLLAMTQIALYTVPDLSEDGLHEAANEKLNKFNRFYVRPSLAQTDRGFPPVTF